MYATRSYFFHVKVIKTGLVKLSISSIVSSTPSNINLVQIPPFLVIKCNMLSLSSLVQKVSSPLQFLLKPILNFCYKSSSKPQSIYYCLQSKCAVSNLSQWSFVYISLFQVPDSRTVRLDFSSLFVSLFSFSPIQNTQDVSSPLLCSSFIRNFNRLKNCMRFQ